jgi:hypothetical protein
MIVVKHARSRIRRGRWSIASLLRSPSDFFCRSARISVRRIGVLTKGKNTAQKARLR